MSAIFWTSSVSKCSLRSFSRARGTISLSVKSRAVSRISLCSSVSSKSIMWALILSGRVLDDAGEALADPDAEHGQAVAAAAAAQLVRERAEQAGARAAERVGDRDRAAVDVQLVVVQAELAHRGEHLRGECLVQLDEVEDVHGDAGAVERLARRRHRSDAHVGRVDAGGAGRDDAGQRLAPQLLGAL